MSKKLTAPAKAGAIPKDLDLETTQEQEVVETTQEQGVVEVLAPNVFIAEDGTELHFSVHHFICPSGQSYTVEEAIASAPEVLELLYKANSFIFKK